MNLQLQRKQVVVLGLAMVLAVAAYWIPTPELPSTPITQTSSHKAEV